MDSTTSGTSGSGSSSDASGDSATISANDFLTLLVTEMQNQDPTADTDPNEYINQLVQVNSLEQLIDINQTLGGALGSSSTGTGTGASGGVAGATATPASAAASAKGEPRAATHLTGAAATGQPAVAALQSSAAQRAPGNLSVPGAMPAAKRVAHALSGRTHAQPATGGPLAAQ
jgi:flagellar basal-body rod modification protein FlgD